MEFKSMLVKELLANDKAKKVLGWVPEHSGIEEILLDAWNWENNRRY